MLCRVSYFTISLYLSLSLSLYFSSSLSLSTSLPLYLSPFHFFRNREKTKRNYKLIGKLVKEWEGERTGVFIWALLSSFYFSYVSLSFFNLVCMNFWKLSSLSLHLYISLILHFFLSLQVNRYPSLSPPLACIYVTICNTLTTA